MNRAHPNTFARQTHFNRTRFVVTHRVRLDQAAEDYDTSPSMFSLGETGYHRVWLGARRAAV